MACHAAFLAASCEGARKAGTNAGFAGRRPAPRFRGRYPEERSTMFVGSCHTGVKQGTRPDDAKC